MTPFGNEGELQSISISVESMGCTLGASKTSGTPSSVLCETKSLCVKPTLFSAVTAYLYIEYDCRPVSMNVRSVVFDTVCICEIDPSGFSRCNRYLIIKPFGLSGGLKTDLMSPAMECSDSQVRFLRLLSPVIHH